MIKVPSLLIFYYFFQNLIFNVIYHKLWTWKKKKKELKRLSTSSY